LPIYGFGQEKLFPELPIRFPRGDRERITIDMIAYAGLFDAGEFYDDDEPIHLVEEIKQRLSRGFRCKSVSGITL